MSELLVADDFKDKVGQTYVIGHDPDGGDDGDAVALELIECTVLEAFANEGSKRTPFRLLFRGPKGLRLRDQMYPVKNTQTGDVIPDLFLSANPPRQGEDGSLFEACFA